ncbi:hypothetical protein H310_15080 [Aphanomyces invadans]|uniref:Integrase catalytic domain-containing protein n=1 Tax=Aphanomyces invadans TaxID=157072 RepID=A0A024T9R9_9STRA|nr:hypothetical protein H310_15080 [Aphanomyces invadans]ETV90087.1 hypothetical protein H310_15080 [Aphanomyces invadans]|eukprot:XP_008881280.1 hypothetical protein H310_15080 [Aphanomyces invadans]
MEQLASILTLYGLHHVQMDTGHHTRNIVLVAVDKLSKRAKYIPSTMTADAPETAKLFFDHVVGHHGLPSVIISGRDPNFTSNYRKSVIEIMNIRQALTTVGRA